MSPIVPRSNDVSKVILDDELRAKLDIDNGGAELCDTSGQVVARVVSEAEYMRLQYDLAWAEFSTPQAKIRQQEAEDAFRRGDFVTSQQLFEELRQLGYMPREGQ